MPYTTMNVGRRCISGFIRSCNADDNDAVLAVINVAAEAYRGVIPADRWHEPYMTSKELAAEIAAGVAVVGFEVKGELVGVMGLQRVHNVQLIRHAYVLPFWQSRGIGAVLLGRLCASTSRPLLVGTWASATWAVRFYERHGFTLLDEDAKELSLRAYWNVSERQIETSVVLSLPSLSVLETQALIAVL